MTTPGSRVHVARCGPHIGMDSKRVLLRRMYCSSHAIAKRICERVMALDEDAAKRELAGILDEWGDRHADVHATCKHRFREIRANLGESWSTCSETTKALVGAHFLSEYSIESAALFNPSIVPHWDQTGVPNGSIRFIISLRATGEGHISSVAFRDGVANSHHRVSLKPNSPKLIEAKVKTDRILKATVLQEIALTHAVTKGWTEQHNEVLNTVLGGLADDFSADEARRKCSSILTQSQNSVTETVCQAIMLLAEANYTVHFPSDSDISQRVLFPSAPSQSNGIEDARFVLFTEDNGDKMYYATFTAYNGRSILPQLMVTKDFNEFRFMTLTGDVTNKGFALFPRRINGKYWMLSRQDDENVLIMESGSLFKWEDPEVLLRPQFPWEAFKIGNCGSPIETPKGWLVLTHGVGPVRRYSIGVAMLDLNNPRKVIGRFPEPIIAPNESEREGYVPNVVYTCGALLHNETVIIPYAMSDSTTSFATVALDELYAGMNIA